jgi:ethanolamine transporter EutH
MIVIAIVAVIVCAGCWFCGDRLVDAFVAMHRR